MGKALKLDKILVTIKLLVQRENTNLNKINMELYSKIMLRFWFILGAVSAIYCTYKGFTEGFNQWAFMYVFSAIAFFMFFMKRMLIRRFNKQMHIPEEQRPNK